MVVAGAPRLTGRDMAARRLDFLANHDWVRRVVTMEPRGHAFMSGTILYPPSSADYDMGLIFIETSGSLPMCGHATIGSITFALEYGLVTPAEPGVVRVETPAGLVVATYEASGQKVTAVKFTNVPSFLLYPDLEIGVPDLGRLRVDIAYGGNFYAIVETQENFTDLAEYSVPDLLKLGRSVQKAVNDAIEIVHPENPSIRGVRHCLWTGRPQSAEADSRVVVIAGDHLVDRSPCGTGTSARVAQRASRHQLKVGSKYVHESLTGGKFVGRIEEHVTVGNLSAVRPSVEGRAYMTGLNTLFVDSNEPYADGFLIG